MILEKSSGGAEMSDPAAYTHELVCLLAEPPQIGDSIKAQIDRSYAFLVRALKQAGRSKEDINRWKWRRVKAFWYKEVPDHAIRTYETRDLELAAALHEARKAHAEYIAENTRLATLLTITDEAFHSPEIERLGGIARGLDRSRADGAGE